MRVIRSGYVTVPRTSSGAWPHQWINRVVDRLWEWRRRYLSRRQLQKMSDHMCKDIGISRADVWREGPKSFWKA